MSKVGADSLSNVIDSDFKRSLLRSIALFRGVDVESIADLLPQCGRMDIAPNQVLLSPDRNNHCVYVVLSGQLAVHIGSLDAPKIADVLPGACAGEMSIIDDKDPSAYVIATEETHAMVISHGLLWLMIDRSHTFAKNLLVVLSERVRSDNAYIANSLGVLRRAEHHAMTDALTGLGNRRWMHTMFDRELSRALRNDDPMCLMMIDIDAFKSFNDCCGHIGGDRVLAAVAENLRERLRPTDLIARFGGDEFAILLPRVGMDDADQTAQRLQVMLKENSPTNLPHPITISIGIACARNNETLDTLVQRADAAMYAAKAGGRDCIRRDA